MLFGDACDPFAVAEFGGIRIKSRNVDLLCELHLPAMEPIMSFYDWNAAKRNDRIGCLLFDYNEIKADNKKNAKPQ